MATSRVSAKTRQLTKKIKCATTATRRQPASLSKRFRRECERPAPRPTRRLSQNAVCYGLQRSMRAVSQQFCEPPLQQLLSATQTCPVLKVSSHFLRKLSFSAPERALANASQVLVSLAEAIATVPRATTIAKHPLITINLGLIWSSLNNPRISSLGNSRPNAGTVRGHLLAR